MSLSTAIVFPGQGSQHLGMMGDFGQYQSLITDVFGEASEHLQYDLLSLCLNGPEEQLMQTEFTQPVLLASGYAIWQLLKKDSGALDVKCLAGHSLGEYTALVAAGALSFKDGLKLVSQRGKLMQSAIPMGTGAMAAVLGLPEDKLTEVCKEASQSGVCELANFNCPGQIVISGEKEAVEHAAILAKEAGAKRAQLLSVSVPSHSSLMQPAAEKFAEYLENVTINSPRIPVYSNVDHQTHNETDVIKSLLLKQLCMPVKWQHIISDIATQDIDCVLEAGPGKVLTTLNKRIDKSLTSFVINNEASFNEVLTHVVQ